MSSAGTSGGVPLDFNLFLTPQQQNLLFAALNPDAPIETASGPNHPRGESSGSQRPNSIQQSPSLDHYDYYLGGDTSIDLESGIDDSHARMVGDASPSKSPEGAESRDKRSHPDDDEEDGQRGGNDAKRRGSGNERIPKKPGRKPITEEPASKRKAQNRAAQRAFRERKEKHVKDLETKVEELEKASRDANNENSVLRVRIERMTTELNEYKQRLSLANHGRAAGKPGQSFGAAAISNLGDINFQFEFPRFGVLPGPDMAYTLPKSPPPTSPLEQQRRDGRPSLQDAGEAAQTTPSAMSREKNMAGIESGPSHDTANPSHNGSRASIDSVPSFGAAATSSPSASSNSNPGGSSSCGTSPEPFTQSPMESKPIDTMTTIGEEQPGLVGVPAFGEIADFSSAEFGWLSPNPAGHFDPQLFGDYRESQDPLLGGNFFDDNYFKDPLEADFSTPFFTPAPPPQPGKKSLIVTIDEENNADNAVVVPDGAAIRNKNDGSGNGYSCRQIWENLQNCVKVQSGEIDIDSLCKELQLKATCNGHGPEVREKDFDKIIKKYLLGCKTTDAEWTTAQAASPAAPEALGAASQ